MKNKNVLEILIVDDEAAGRGVLKKFIPEILKLPHEIYEANSVANAHLVIEKTDIDILFLDIQMPEQNGFELLKQLPVINFEIIFVTGFDNYAVYAFKFNAIDYLLKPVDVEELKNAVSKAIIKLNDKQTKSEKKGNLIGVIPDNIHDKRIAVHVKEKVMFIQSSIVSYITAIDNYSQITTFNNEKYITPRLLKEFEFYLSSNPSFIRVNRTVIINAAFIKSYTKNIPCFIEMHNGEEFEISRRKKTDVLNLLEML